MTKTFYIITRVTLKNFKLLLLHITKTQIQQPPPSHESYIIHLAAVKKQNGTLNGFLKRLWNILLLQV